jgi:hypothetical protein
MVVKSKTESSVKCEVVDGGELKSRRHLNVRGKSATLPSITGQNSYNFFYIVDYILLIIVISYGYSLYIDLLQRRIGMISSLEWITKLISMLFPLLRMPKSYTN